MGVMEVSQGSEDPPSLAAVLRLSDFRHRKHRTYFSRGELSLLLGLYSSRVISGEWRDYAIDHDLGVALFSVFRHTHDRPLFMISKTVGPRGAEYALFEGSKRIRRSTSLAEVLAAFDKRPRLIKG
jgi:hypothetical protein